MNFAVWAGDRMLVAAPESVLLPDDFHFENRLSFLPSRRDWCGVSWGNEGGKTESEPGT